MTEASRRPASTVLVGLSGGVDSSVAALLLQREGYHVIGATMRIYGGRVDERSLSFGNACYGPGEEDDIEAAGELAEILGIPYHVIDLRDEYSRTVLDYFKSEYRNGRTPNPCLKCNAEMKFGYLLEKTQQSGIDFDYFATGHYARIFRELEEGPFLHKAKQTRKDQSYFLYRLSKRQLSRTLFPLGELTKEEVRNIAEEAGLPSARSEESQDFIDGGDYSVLFDKKDFTKGDIVDTTGNKIGIHNGLVKYTVGQRRGLGISYSEPLYVVEKLGETNTLVVGTKEELKTSTCTIENTVFHDDLEKYTHLSARLRNSRKEVPVEISSCGKVRERDEEDKLMVEFLEPQLSVTPGQSLVLYSQDRVVGGGVIS